MSRVDAKTSLDIIGIYIKMVRDRFTGNSSTTDFPWAWDPDDKKTRILIEAGGSEFEDSTDGRPGIFIDRGAIIFPKIVAGDRAAHHMSTGRGLFYSTPNGQIAIDCVSRSRGESSLLGDIVAHHLVMSSDLLLSYYNFRDITPVTLSPTQPWEKDNKCYITRVSSEFVYDIAWSSIPLATKISRIQSSSGSQTEEGSFSDLTLISLGLADPDN